MNRQYVQSERAHFMCPQMCFGMEICVKRAYRSDIFISKWKDLCQAHPFLRARIAREADTGRLYYDVSPECALDFELRNSADTLFRDFASVEAAGWNVFREGLMRVFAYPEGDQTRVLLAAHHLLTDGVGLANLALEFADAYAGGVPPVYAEEALMTDIGEISGARGLTGISRALVRYANRKWRGEAKAADYERYIEFSKDYAAAHPVTYECFCLNEDRLAEIRAECRENGVTVNDWLLAQTLIRANTRKIIVAADIRGRLANDRKGALGNYATAFSVVSGSRTRDVWQKAKEVHRLVSDVKSDPQRLTQVLACYFEMEPGLLDAAAMSALGGFSSKAASFVGKRMFGFGGAGSYSVTNLGKFESQNASLLRFIPPASPAAKATIGVVTLNREMRVCVSGHARSDGGAQE